MTTNDDPTTKAKPTLAEIRALIDAAPLSVLVEIRDYLRDQLADLVTPPQPPTREA